MKLDYATYLNKLRGCWNGKNIGGVLGMPFECKRGVFEVQYYTQDLREPLPNDDLDLQLVWLNAVEKYGRNVNSHILGEYWNSYIIPAWAEYGAGKNNLRMGLVPPLSGYVGNKYRDSNGSYILSEIWACLCPGHPALAVQYAYEDAIVDHSHEGVYAEIFCAAVESAAFVCSERDTLIDIGLSYLPQESAIHTAVACVRQCHADGLTWREARKKLFQTVPCSFGLIGTRREDMAADEPLGPIGYDAPCHIGLIVLGWLYGEGDFDRSVCIAASCGEDSDCTAGTLASILGIILGIDGIAEKWLQPLGGMITTACVDVNEKDVVIPKTVEELVSRIVRQTARFLDAEDVDLWTDGPGYAILADETALRCAPRQLSCWYARDMRDIFRNPFLTRYDFIPFKVYVDYAQAPYIQEGTPRTFTLTFENNYRYQQWLRLRWILPPEWEISPAPVAAIGLEQAHCNVPLARVQFTVTPHNLQQERYDLLVQIVSNGRAIQATVPIVLLVGDDYQIFEE